MDDRGVERFRFPLKMSSKAGDIELADLAEEHDGLLAEGDRALPKASPVKAPVDTAPKEQTIMQTALEFLFCFVSLQGSYIIWGMMQELIMDTEFEPTPMTPSGRFPSATFCVFSNRFLAIIVSAMACYYSHGTVASAAPLISFTPAAISNTLSSWGQYEALTYVSFALQTIFKSTKLIPVMLMGTVLKGTVYTRLEYMEAIGITVGIVIFSMSKGNYTRTNLTHEVIGFLLLSLYVLADSFTSQWQSKLYKDYGKIDHFQMMFGVNASSIIITTVALVLSGELPQLVEFLLYNPSAFYYNIITAICSTTGQFAIFYTIKRFGPDVFTVIMTTRQMLSIVVSNYLFDHSMSVQSYVGAGIVFSVISYSIYRKIKDKQAKDAAKAAGKGAVAETVSSDKD